MNKKEKNTKEKLEKLSKTLGDFEFKEEKTPEKVSSPSLFKTGEVIALLLLTSIVSLLMGGVVVYKLTYGNGKKIDPELQSFIKNYDYVINNYYEKLDKSKLIDSAIAGMLTSLDKNSAYVGTSDSDFSIFLEGQYKGIGIQVYNDDDNNVAVYTVFENSPASRAGLKEGDVLVKINDEDILGKATGDVVAIIKKQKDEFNLTYRRDGEEKTVKIKLSDVSLTSITSKMIERDDKKIGYIGMSIFANNTYSQFKDALEKLEKEEMNSLIIDVRGNSGGHLTAAEDIISLFLDSSHPIYQIKSKESQKKFYSKGKTTKKYKIVILVDGGSASASEVTASALKEQYGATIVGEKTYGKGTVQELQTLPSGGQYKLTTKMWLTSKGNMVNKKGIKPDVDVTLDEKYYDDAKEENDNQLQTAINEALK